MHCPGCGTQSSMEQKFCRVCGMNLDALSKALAAQDLSFAADDSHTDAARHSRRRMMSWVRWGVIIMFAGGFIGITGKKLMHNEIMSGVGALIALAGMFLVGFGSLAPRKRSRQTKAAIAPEQAKPTVPLTLELPPASVSSVTERTTELLEVEPLKVSAHKRD